MANPENLSDAELVERWQAVEDYENLTPDEQALIDEMEKRNIDF